MIIRRLYEMSRSLKEIKLELYNHSEQIRENLMKIFLLRDCSAKHHWISELFGNCHDVKKCNGSNKYPRESVILQEIWKSWEDSYSDKLEKYIVNLQNSEKDVKFPDKFSSKNLYDFMKDYCKWLSKILSKDGVVTFPEVEQKVNQLLQKYEII